MKNAMESRAQITDGAAHTATGGKAKKRRNEGSKEANLRKEGQQTDHDANNGSVVNQDASH